MNRYILFFKLPGAGYGIPFIFAPAAFKDTVQDFCPPAFHQDSFPSAVTVHDQAWNPYEALSLTQGSRPDKATIFLNQ